MVTSITDVNETILLNAPLARAANGWHVTGSVRAATVVDNRMA